MPSNETPTPEQLYILLARAEREQLDATIIDRLKVILHFARNQHSISETCNQYNISRSTFHRWMERFNPSDLSTLADKSHKPINPRQSGIEPETIELIRRYRTRYPQMGKERITDILFRDHALEISVSSVGRIIESECLYFADTPLHWKKRMAHQGRTVDLTSGYSPFPPTPADAERAERGEPENSNVRFTHATPSPRMYPKPVEWAERGLEGEVNSWMTWRAIKRFLLISSILTNAAFILILVGMALAEHATPTIPNTQQEQSFHAAPSQPFIP